MNEIVLVDPKTLVPHPNRELAGSTLSENDGKYQLILDSIEEMGIRAPLMVQSGTNVILGGHTRCRIALELGLEKVPVQYYDIDDETARYRMVMDNHHRIGDEKDLMKLAWTFSVVVQRDGFSRGGDRKTNETLHKRKTIDEIAASFDMKETNFRRYLSLLHLIPALQQVVSDGKIGLKAGALLSRLSKKNQVKVIRSIPTESLQRSNWYMTEREAKSYVNTYRNPGRRTEAQDSVAPISTDEPDIEFQTVPMNTGTAASKDVTINFDEDDLENSELVSFDTDDMEQEEDKTVESYISNPIDNKLIARSIIDMPERQRMMDLIRNLHSEDIDFLKKIENSRKQQGLQLAMIEESDKRWDFMNSKLDAAAQTYTEQLKRVEVELLSLRTLIGEEINQEVLHKWMILKDQICHFESSVSIFDDGLYEED